MIKASFEELFKKMEDKDYEAKTKLLKQKPTGEGFVKGFKKGSWILLPTLRT